MYHDLVDVIRRSIEEARARGRDDQTQSACAVRWVRTVRPDLSNAEALRAVNSVRQG